MENPTPFDLNAAMRRWQQSFANSPAFEPDNLEELTSHLRASIQRLKETGLSEERAFEVAVQRIGERGALELEFAKTRPAMTWSLPLFMFWIVSGTYLFYSVHQLISGMIVLDQVSRNLRLRPNLTSGPIVIDSSDHYSFLLWPSSIVMLCLIAALAFVFVMRLATGNWGGFNRLINLFEYAAPALGLLGLGCALTLLPGFLAALMANSLHLNILLLYNVALNLIFGLIMVSLARGAMGKISPPDGPFPNRATAVRVERNKKLE